MNLIASRRGFLGAGLGLAAGSGLAAPAKLEMPMRVLGKTGMKLTVMGFGCMITSDGTVIEQAADAGINYFDTARGYQGGNNERMVGAALKGRRDKLFVSTKAKAHDAAGLKQELETSLSTLQMDYVDIWYLHSRSAPSDIPVECFDMQDEMKRQGKIRFRGVSLHSGHKVLIPWLIEQKRTDVILASYNFSLDAETEAAIKKAADAGLGVIAMKVMAGGFRTNRPGSELHGKLSKPGAMPAALKYAVRNPWIHSSVPSITDLDQLDENYKAVCAGWKEEDRQTLAAYDEHIRPLYCRLCGTCGNTCRKGLPVSDIIRFVSYAEGYGQFPLGREHWLTLSEEQRAVRCADCTSCSVQCPNGVRVGDRVARAQELFA
jgi:predicted aldo/keto reductase-like oxidoreductase